MTTLEPSKISPAVFPGKDLTAASVASIAPATITPTSTSVRIIHLLEKLASSFVKQMDSLKDFIGEENAANLMREIETLTREFKNLGWKEARPWKEFFAVFKPPQQWKLSIIQERMETNFLQYRTNYLYVVLAVLAFDVITSPFIAFMLVLGAIIFLTISSKEQIKIGETSFQGKEKLYLAGGLSGLLLLLTGVLMNILTTLGIASFLVSLHMLFRPRDLNSKYNKLKQKFREEVSRGKESKDYLPLYIYTYMYIF